MLSCSNKTGEVTTQKANSKIEFIIETDLEIEKIIFSKIGGFEQDDIYNFEPNVEITLDEPINDLYQMLLQIGNKNIVTDFWLKGNDITINGHIVDSEFQLDTIINSPFYYYTIDVLNKYRKTNNTIQTQDEINSSLMKDINKNLDNPFSIDLASIFIKRNLDNLENLKELHQILSTQSDHIKDHFLSDHSLLQKLLDVDSIQIDTFKFSDIEGHSVKLPINKDSIYMLDFWFTRCAPCIADHKKMLSNINLFNELGIEIIGISTDYNQSDWIDFLEKKNYKWKNYIELSESSLSEYVGLASYPTYLIITGNGEILSRSSSLEKSISFIKEDKFRF